VHRAADAPAHLPIHPVTALAARHIGDPDRWLNGAEQLLHHDLAAAGRVMQHRQGADEDPFPPEPALAKAGVFPVTRAEVSSEQTTSLAVTISRIAVAAVSSGSRARASMLLVAPSLIVRVNISPSERRAVPGRWRERNADRPPTPRSTGRTASPLGAGAGTRAPQHAQLPPNSLTRVTSGLIGGSSMRSYTWGGVCRSAGKAAAQSGQASSLASTMRSGCDSSARPTPGRLLWGGLSPTGTIGLRGLRRRQRGITRCLRRSLQRQPLLQFSNARQCYFRCPANGSSLRPKFDSGFGKTVLRQ
jgi:hypothetical protein